MEYWEWRMVKVNCVEVENEICVVRVWEWLVCAWRCLSCSVSIQFENAHINDKTVAWWWMSSPGRSCLMGQQHCHGPSPDNQLYTSQLPHNYFYTRYRSNRNRVQTQLVFLCSSMIHNLWPNTTQWSISPRPIIMSLKNTRNSMNGYICAISALICQR